VTVQLQDANPDAPYLMMCTFWLAPSTPKALNGSTWDVGYHFGGAVTRGADVTLSGSAKLSRTT
jgi:hypothetical protein